MPTTSVRPPLPPLLKGGRTTATAHRPVLSAEQLEFFDREGYLVVDNLFTEKDLQPVIDEVHVEVNRQAEELVAAGELTQTYASYGFERQLAMIGRETEKVMKGISDGRMAGPAIFNLIRHARLLDLAEQFCGPELIASAVYRLRPKVPGHKRGEVPWHQDSGYTEMFCDKYLMLTVWLPLVDASEERGCLWVLPRAHKQGIKNHYIPRGNTYLKIYAKELGGRRPVCVPVKKGGVLLLSNMTPHASFTNSSDVVRWSMDLRYQSAALPTNAQISRLEGELDSSTNPQSIPLACYPPEADFLVRSAKRPNEVVNDPEKFERIRKSHMANPWLKRRWS